MWTPGVVAQGVNQKRLEATPTYASYPGMMGNVGMLEKLTIPDVVHLTE